MEIATGSVAVVHDDVQGLAAKNRGSECERQLLGSGCRCMIKVWYLL